MKLIKMNCPACAGLLEVPDNLTVAHCLYCGNKILLSEDSAIQEQRDLAKYIELCKVAVDAGNTDDILKYCNLILERDPKNIEAWIQKARAAFGLTTAKDNRYDEAYEYLSKAATIAPNDLRIQEEFKDLRGRQAQWYNHLGNLQWDHTQRIFDIYAYRSLIGGHSEGIDASRVEAIETMEYYMLAATYAPEDLTILENIENVYKRYSVVNWNRLNPEIQEKVKYLQKIREKKKAKDNYSQLVLRLNKAKLDLGQLRTQKGFFVSGKVKDKEREIQQLEMQIAKLEQFLAQD